MNEKYKDELKGINIKPNRFLRFTRKINWLVSVYLKSEHDSIVMTRNGKLAFHSKDKTTGRILHVYRNHEFHEMEDVVSFLKSKNFISKKDKNIVVDIGGYIGMSSTGFLLNNLFDNAISIEPSPENFRLLEKNIRLNRLENRLKAYNIALSDKKGVLEFELSKKNYGDNRIRKSARSGSYGEEEREVIKVEANTFDTFLEEHPEIDQEKIKLLWMDIQGHEGLFLQGAQDFIQAHSNVPTAMEFWPYGIERSGLSVDTFMQLVSKLYKKFYILGEYTTIYEIKQLEKFYKEHPTGADGLNILLLN